MASLLPWDTLFLAGFAYSGYRTVGRWFKYTTDTAKAQTDAGYFEGFHEFLASQAASGDRSKAMPGAGAEASGQGHLWSGWQSMNAKQKIALLHEMQQVLEWTGQDAGFNALARYHGQPWSALPHAAKQALLAAADQLDWSFLKDMVQVCWGFCWGVRVDGRNLVLSMFLGLPGPLSKLRSGSPLAQDPLRTAYQHWVLVPGAGHSAQQTLGWQQPKGS
eukprot:GHRR01035288.1.p1 GENE.GHRR01035288.1~~GHRR01035288.1.p1  ORF type:complete len:219 (+),score=56.64 GHRR01035288.1:126-782(+)